MLGTDNKKRICNIRFIEKSTRLQPTEGPKKKTMQESEELWIWKMYLLQLKISEWRRDEVWDESERNVKRNSLQIIAAFK